MCVNLKFTRFLAFSWRKYVNFTLVGSKTSVAMSVRSTEALSPELLNRLTSLQILWLRVIILSKALMPLSTLLSHWLTKQSNNIYNNTFHIVTHGPLTLQTLEENIKMRVLDLRIDVFYTFYTVLSWNKNSSQVNHLMTTNHKKTWKKHEATLFSKKHCSQ